MSIFKCKMCGGDLTPKEGEKICECEFCGTKQTLPSSCDEKALNSIARGNLLRNKCEFDKAYNLYNQLIVEGIKDAEIFWNLVLCKYGITYVDDYDGTKKPTINRMSNVSILDDEDYLKSLELADVVSKEEYIVEANEINKIQKEILEISNKEKPYDIFISYKETDEFGQRTKDSVLAYDIYESLTKVGYKVFLSRVSLSKIAGKSYEPYIYGALFSSKVMLVVTTSEDYVNAVWVKNEWSRFLNMIKKDNSKCLIPCYLDMDPYDLPKELRNIQSIDMSKIGAIQDLKEGLSKIIVRESKEETHDNDITKKIIYINDLLKNFSEKKNITLAKSLLDNLLIENPRNYELHKSYFRAEFEIENLENYIKILLDTSQALPDDFMIINLKGPFKDIHYDLMIDSCEDINKKNGLTAAKYCFAIRALAFEGLNSYQDYCQNEDTYLAYLQDNLNPLFKENDEVKNIVKEYYKTIFSDDKYGIFDKYFLRLDFNIKCIGPFIMAAPSLGMSLEEVKALLKDLFTRYKEINIPYFLQNNNIIDNLKTFSIINENFIEFLSKELLENVVSYYLDTTFYTEVTFIDKKITLKNKFNYHDNPLYVDEDFKLKVLKKLQQIYSPIWTNLSNFSSTIQNKFCLLITDIFYIFYEDENKLDQNFCINNFKSLNKVFLFIDSKLNFDDLNEECKNKVSSLKEEMKRIKSIVDTNDIRKAQEKLRKDKLELEEIENRNKKAEQVLTNNALSKKCQTVCLVILSIIMFITVIILFVRGIKLGDVGETFKAFIPIAVYLPVEIILHILIKKYFENKNK